MSVRLTSHSIVCLFCDRVSASPRYDVLCPVHSRGLVSVLCVCLCVCMFVCVCCVCMCAYVVCFLMHLWFTSFRAQVCIVCNEYGQYEGSHEHTPPLSHTHLTPQQDRQRKGWSQRSPWERRRTWITSLSWSSLGTKMSLMEYS